MTAINRGFFALLAAAIVFASFGFFVRELDKMFGDYAQVAARSLVAFVVLGFLIIRGRKSLLIPKNKRRLAALFAISFPLTVILFTLSVNQIKASNTVFMLYIGTITTSLVLGTIAYKESLTLKKGLALCLVLIGLLSFIYPFNLQVISVGVALGLLSGVFDGISNATRKGLKDIQRETLLFYQYGTGIVLATVFSVASGTVFVKEVVPNSLVVLVIFGLLLILIGNLLLYGFSHLDVNIGTIVLATELFFALVINFLLLGEQPSGQEIVGGIFIFLAAVVVEFDFSRLKLLRHANR